jgi:hypothetical protein
MWAAVADLGLDWKDRPCNTHVYFDARGGVLNMTVCCRSNDALWGAYGANAVHFSILQEVIAAGVGIPMGVYRQFSNNFHAYWNVPLAAQWLKSPPVPMERPYPKIIPLIDKSETVQNFLIDCHTIFRPNLPQVWHTHFFHRVAVPLKHVYDARKSGSRTWKQQLDQIAECDWKQAFIEWTERRESVSE